MRPTPHRDRLQLAGAPEHVRLLVTLFSVVAALALLLGLVPTPATAPPSPTAWADYGGMGRTLLLFALLALAQSALVGATPLPASGKTAYGGAAFLVALLHAASPWLSATLMPGSALLPLITGALLALAGLVGAGLVIRAAWFTPVPVVERETVWPDRGPRRDGEARPPREGREGRERRDRPRRGPRAEGSRPEGAARPARPAGDRAEAAGDSAGDSGGSSADREARDAERRRRGRGSRRRGAARSPRPEGEDGGEGRSGGGALEAGVSVSRSDE